MSIESQHRSRTWPSMSDWFEVFPFGPRTQTDEQLIRVEEYEKDGNYTIRAELPGVDPDKDVEVVVDHGLLTVHAERTEETKDKKHTEFRYGSFTRSVRLPAGVKEDEIAASYDKGVLTVTAPIGKPEESGKKIEIKRET
jgi:HSP20 family protein